MTSSSAMSLNKSVVDPKKMAFFLVDESYLEPGKVLIALVAIDGERYLDFTSKNLSERKESRLFKISKAKLHYTDDTPSIRSDMAAWVLNPAPISAYFLIQDVGEDIDDMTAKRWVYKNTFPKLLLKSILRKQKKLYGKRYPINIAFENLTDSPTTDIIFFTECVSTLKYTEVGVRVITKQDPLIALPDYMAGILRANMLPNAQEKDKINAKLVEEIIGLIVVAKKGGNITYFTRGDEVRRFLANPTI